MKPSSPVIHPALAKDEDLKIALWKAVNQARVENADTLTLHLATDEITTEKAALEPPKA